MDKLIFLIQSRIVKSFVKNASVIVAAALGCEYAHAMVDLPAPILTPATKCVIKVLKTQCPALTAEAFKLKIDTSASSYITEDECFARLADVRQVCSIKMPVSAQFSSAGVVISERFLLTK